MPASALERLADRLREMSTEAARDAAPRVERFRVAAANPMRLEDIGGDLVLEEGDPDVEIDARLLAERPSAGDVVRVHRDAGGDWIVAGVIA